MAFSMKRSPNDEKLFHDVSHDIVRNVAYNDIKRFRLFDMVLDEIGVDYVCVGNLSS